jgi:hypothetical protein
MVPGERVDGSIPAGEVYLPEPEPTAPPVVLSADIAPPDFVPVPPVRPRTAPTRFPPPASARPSVRPPVSGQVIAPRAIPHLPPSASPRAAPVVHASGGHMGGLHGPHHAGGGGGGAAVAAVVGAVALIALVAIIAENSEPKPFDGWIRTFPEHPLFFQRDLLPALHAEAQVALGEGPDDDALAAQKIQVAGQLLANQGRGAAVVHDGGERRVQLVGEVGDETGGFGLVGLVDAREAVAEEKDLGVVAVGVGSPSSSNTR